MNIDKYISELLFLHDCAIIPEFGGFVTNYSPAKIHPIQHTLSPPSKKIAFNIKLQNNDGLLASYISKEENISYADANKRIQSHLEMFNTILKEGKQVTIKNVGVLFYDVEKNLQFEADDTMNYLLDSFGLVSLQSPAIKRENIQKRIEKQFQDRPTIQSSVPVKRFPWKIIIPVPFVALAIWGSLSLTSLNINYNSLNPFANNKTEAPIVKIQPPVEETKISAAVSVTPEPMVAVSAPIAAEAPVTIVTPKEQITPATATNTSGDYLYFVVAGCFRETANAENMLLALKSKGFNALIKGNNIGGLTVVCYGGFTTKQEAIGELVKVQSENDKNAWLSGN